MRRAAIGTAVLALLSGCAGPEPFDFPNTWRPTGANDANLAAMAARPLAGSFKLPRFSSAVRNSAGSVVVTERGPAGSVVSPEMLSSISVKKRVCACPD